MKISINERNHELRENMRGGDGTAVLDTVPKAALPEHMRLAGMITLKKGCGIGSHVHEGETEIFIIHSGNGIVEDNGTEKSIGPGEILLTGNGASHGIRNEKEAPLIFSAVIVTKD